MRWLQEEGFEARRGFRSGVTSIAVQANEQMEMWEIL